MDLAPLGRNGHETFVQHHPSSSFLSPASRGCGKRPPPSSPLLYLIHRLCFALLCFAFLLLLLPLPANNARLCPHLPPAGPVRQTREESRTGQRSPAVHSLSLPNIVHDDETGVARVYRVDSALSLVPVPHSKLEDASCPVLLRLQASLARLGIPMVLHVHLPLPNSVNTAAGVCRRATMPGTQDRVDARSPPQVWTSGARHAPH